MNYIIKVEGLKDSRQKNQLISLLQADESTAVKIQLAEGIIDISTDRPIGEICQQLSENGLDIVDVELQ